MPELTSLTASDIARLAGVTRATVSNWRRRHADFPQPSGGTDASPAYDRAEVEAWLAARGALPQLPPGERFWREILDAATRTDLGKAVALAALAVSEGSGPERGTAGGSRARIAAAAAEAVTALGPDHALGTLTEKYAEMAGVSVTPAPVAALMAALADPGQGAVLDPACGTGATLAAALDHGAARACGQELDEALAALAAARLRLGKPAAETVVHAGDSLARDAYRGLLADAVLCHPPFATRDWPQEELAGDVRWEYGIPPKAESELAWAQHSLAHLRPGGLAVMLMPPAVASRPSGRRIRTEFLRRGALRAVASLPPGAARPSHIPLQLWILERPQGSGPSDPLILLADLAEPPGAPARVAGNGAKAGWDQVHDTLLEAWRLFNSGATETASAQAGEDSAGTWRIMRVIDLLDEAVDLTPARHVGAGGAGKSPSRTSETLSRLRARMRAALGVLEEGEPGAGWLPRESEDKWRTLTVAELARSGLVALHRAQGPGAGSPDLLPEAKPEDVCPLLTSADVRTGAAPSGAVPRAAVQAGWVTISAGDVIIPAGLDELTRALVATGEHDGAILGEGLHLIRPDLARMDPWFLGGVLSARQNARQASYGTASIRIDARRLAVPHLPLGEQRLYGEAFREVSDFSAAIRDLAAIGGDLAELLGTSLADGTLMPSKR